MHKTSLLAAALIATLGCASLASAQQPGQAGHGHHGMAADGHLYDQLNLSDAQRTRIDLLAQQAFAQAKPQMQALRQARQAFDSATPGTATYQTAASNLAEAEADAARTRMTQRADLRAQVYQLLTPAQRTKLASLRAERKAQIQQRRAARMQGGDTRAPDPSTSTP